MSKPFGSLPKAPPELDVDRKSMQGEPAARAVRVAAPDVKAAAAIAPVSTSASIEMFGTFLLGEDEFALPASCIREVVNVSEEIMLTPSSPASVEGVFTLRGTVIPVLTLGKIFDAAAPGASHPKKIAIVDHDQVQVGILFHDIGQVLRVHPEQRSRLEHRDPAIYGVIVGTIRLEEGTRLIEILDPAALVRIENVPRVVALKAAELEEKSKHFHLQTDRRQCVSFRVGGTAFAFAMSAIQEIIHVPESMSSVLHSKLCSGRINLRGNAVAVVAFARVLGLPDADAAAEQRIVIARIGNTAIGLLVDSVDNIFSYFPEDVLPLPLLGKARAGMFGGCIHKEGIGAVLFLNQEAIFTQAEIADLT